MDVDRTSADHKYLPTEAQSVELLKELHILTREGKLNQDTRRKLKQVQHLLGFIEPLIRTNPHQATHIVDHGAGKSYLGFLLYDSYFKAGLPHPAPGTVTGVEARTELVERSQALAQRLGFDGMQFLNTSVSKATRAAALPARIDIVTALHACDTATDDAISFGLAHNAQHMVLVPCCQAELAAYLRGQASRPATLKNNPLAELWRRPLHTREFGSQLTNVLRCLWLESAGYKVTVTELVGWEHSMKNELIVASQTRRSPAGQAQQGVQGMQARESSRERLAALLALAGLDEVSAIRQRYLATPPGV